MIRLEKGAPRPKVKFVWSKIKIEAARLLAEDDLTDKQIGAQLGVSTKALYRWKQFPEFSGRIRTLQSAWEARVMSTGIANKARRMNVLKDLHERQQTIIHKRAEEMTIVEVDPETGKEIIKERYVGGSSGLIAVTKKSIGYGEFSETVEEEVFDAALSREVRATLAQAAEETGQSISKHEISGPDGGPLHISVGVLDDIAAKVKRAREANETGGDAVGAADDRGADDPPEPDTVEAG